MRIISTIVFVTLMVQSAFSQDIEKCREIVKITTEAINAKSSVELEKHLASDFEIASQKGDVAKIVLKQLFTQLGDTVQLYTEVNAERIEKSLTLIYSISYSKMGQKNATFVFDEHNKLKKLELFKMEVKTMDKSKREISKPEKEVITIPFIMIGNLIAVDVMLNNEKRVFLFDSGSPSVILNSKYIQTNDTVNKKTISSAKGVGGSISGMDIEEIKKLEFGGIIMENQDVLTLDISHLEKFLETNIEIYGLIGYELIKDYDLLFDYEKKELTLINPDFFAQYKNNELSEYKLTIVPFGLSSHIPVIKARIGNKDYSFGIDCGAETNLMDKELLAPMLTHLKHIEKDTLSGAGKNRIEVTKGLIKKVYIEKKRFKNVPTLFNDMSHLNNGYKLKLDGLMGYELLSKQKIIISYKRKEMILLE
jgi:hypothetical protein